MIKKFFIQEWRESVPWRTEAMVEQDLIICRALVSIFSDEFLASQLAFRGGTALHKLYLYPQSRYSEDIDLVQINPGPIKEILHRLGEVLDWLPDKIVKQKRYNNTIIFRTFSESLPVQPIRLKVEINCFEHFNVLGLQYVPFEVANSWFSGACTITTYSFNELIGTKLRALYQRKKGRDLFDLVQAIDSGMLDAEKVLQCYNKYMLFVTGAVPTYKQFVQNLDLKIQDIEFMSGFENLLREDSPSFNFEEAYNKVKTVLIDKMPGRRD